MLGLIDTKRSGTIAVNWVKRMPMRPKIVHPNRFLPRIWRLEGFVAPNSQKTHGNVRMAIKQNFTPIVMYGNSNFAPISTAISRKRFQLNLCITNRISYQASRLATLAMTFDDLKRLFLRIFAFEV